MNACLTMHQQSELKSNLALALYNRSSERAKIWKINSTVEHTGNFTLQLDPCHLTISTRLSRSPSPGSQPILQKLKRHNKCNSWRFDSRLLQSRFLMWNTKFRVSSFCWKAFRKFPFFIESYKSKLKNVFSQWSKNPKINSLRNCECERLIGSAQTTGMSTPGRS